MTDLPKIFTSAAPSAGPFRDDMDIYELMFEYFPPSRPDLRNNSFPLFIDDDTGHSRNFQQVKARVDALSLSLYYNESIEFRPDTVVSIFSPNNIDFPTVVWAVHRIGGIICAANPAFQSNELCYQLEATKATGMFVHQAQIDAGLAAAKKAGIPKEKVIVIEDVTDALAGRNNQIQGCRTLQSLVKEGEQILKQKGVEALRYSRRVLKVGEAQSKLAFISFSSGTTGLPKGVAIQHYAPASNVLQSFTFNKVTNSTVQDPEARKHERFRACIDSSLGVLPFFHIYGLVMGIHLMFYCGCTNVVVPKFKGIEHMIQSIIRHKITIWFLVPPQVVLLCKHPYVSKFIPDLRRLAHFVMIGAAPLNDDLSKQLMGVLPGLDWGQGYGMTESATLTTMVPPGGHAVLGSAGRLISDVEAKVVKPDGVTTCGINEPGELWVRSPSITLGYMNNHKATAEMFLSDGFMKTGDEVVINEHGDVFIVDRLKELIKTSGFQVAPAELEGFLLDHADVADVGVIPIPDEKAGERPLAYIALTAAAKARVAKNGKVEEEKIKQRVLQFVEDNKIKYKHLAAVRIIDQIPKTASGKILRRTLRDMIKNEPAQSRL